MEKKIELSEAAKLAQREYHRKWKRENKEKVRLYQARYWGKKAKEQEGAK